MPQRTTTLPRTVAHSAAHAKTLWCKAHDRAVQTYGDARTAHRVAYAALKHQYAKKRDRWVKKRTRGPSDPRAARSIANTPHRVFEKLPTAGGRVMRTTKRAVAGEESAFTGVNARKRIATALHRSI